MLLSAIITFEASVRDTAVMTVLPSFQLMQALDWSGDRMLRIPVGDTRELSTALFSPLQKFYGKHAQQVHSRKETLTAPFPKLLQAHPQILGCAA